MSARKKAGINTRYHLNYQHRRLRNLKQWVNRLYYAGKRRSPHPLMHITAISFWAINRKELGPTHSKVRARLKAARNDKRRT